MTAGVSITHSRMGGVLALGLVLASVCLPPSAMAQDFLPPAAMVEEAVSSHPDVRAGTGRIDMARGEARLLGAGPHEWKLTGSYIRREAEGFPGFDEYDATLSRAIRLPGKGTLDRKAGEAGVRSAEQFSEDARHQTALLLMSHWMDWLGASETEAIAAAQAEALKGELGILERRGELDDAAHVEVETARAAYDQARSILLKARGEASRARAALASTFPALVLPEAPPAIPAPPVLAEPGVWEERMIGRSHEIGYYAAEAERLEMIARRSRADRAPDPEVGVRAFSERNGEESGAALVVSIPFGGGARAGAAARDAAAAGVARDHLERIRREIRSVARQDIILAQSLQDAWISASRARASSEAAIERIRRGFALDAVELADLLLAERRHAEVRLLEAEARAEANTAWLRLMIDSHELWIEPE